MESQKCICCAGKNRNKAKSWARQWKSDTNKVRLDEGMQPKQERVFFLYDQDTAIKAFELTECLAYFQRVITAPSKEPRQEKGHMLVSKQTACYDSGDESWISNYCTSWLFPSFFFWMREGTAHTHWQQHQVETQKVTYWLVKSSRRPWRVLLRMTALCSKVLFFFFCSWFQPVIGFLSFCPFFLSVLFEVSGLWDNGETECSLIVITAK